VHSVNDRVAAEIAHRLVALATYEGAASGDAAALRALAPELFARDGGQLIATGAGDAELDRSLLRGADLGYVIALPRRTLDPCLSWRTLASRIPWIRPGAAALLGEAGPALITSPRAPALTVDWDNTLRVPPQRQQAGGVSR
jgi:hypothetical protein